MSSLLDHLDSNQSENDDIHLLFPKCKPRASSVGTESQSSESQSNSQQYLADNYRDQNLNHHHHSLSNQFPLHPHHNHNHHQQQLAGGGSSSSSSTRQSSRRHSSSGFTQITPQHHQQQQQPIIPDNLLKHAKHSSYPPLLNTPDQVANNSSFITNSGQLSPYDNNNLTHDNALGSNNSITNKSHHHHQSSSSSSRHYYHHHHQQQQQLSDSSDNFPVVVPSSHYTTGSSERGGGHIQTNSNNSSLLSSSKKGESSSKSHHHSRSKNSISSRNSRHEAATSASGSGSGVAAQNISQSNSTNSRHSHHHSRSHHHHRSKKLSHMTESSSCEPISPSTSNLGNKSSSHRYGKSRVGGGEGNSCGGPTKSYSSLSLGSGMECEPLDDPHHPHHRHHHQQQQQHHLNYDDGFSSNSRSQRNLATSLISNGASSGGGNNGGGGVGCLRDSRIEIAGGREIYSQNRIRAGRRLRGSSSTSSSTEMMADSSMSITASSSSSTGTKHSRKKSPNLQHQLQQHSFTNGGEMVDGDDLSVWEPKHSGGSNTIPPRSSSNHHHHHNHHQSSSGGGLGSGSSSHRQHHHHHSHQQQQQQHPSQLHQQSQQHHTRSRHGCNYSHCDHSKQDMSPPGNGSNPITVKETVFSSEVTSIEKALESNSKNQTGTKNTGMGSSYIYETSVMNDTCGEIIFDDIGNWNRNRERGRGGGGRRNSSAATEGGGLCVERRNKDQSSMMRRSPSTGANKHGGQLNFFQNGGGGSGMSGAGANIGGENEMHCFNSLEQMEQHSGSSINASSAPTVLLHGSPSPSTRGGNTTPSGYESDEYSGVTPVSLNMIGSGGNSGNSRTADKGCLPNNRLIGALPIAEYEGSPKRYGLRQPTHPMPTHFDLVDVDMQMNSGASTVTSIPINSSTSVDQPSHLHQLQKSHSGSGNVVQSVSLISPTQSSKPTVPTSASSSSSSLDNTNSNSASVSSNSSGSVHHNNHNHHHHHHRNIYGNGRIISPRIISPSQSISSFPSRVPGFPQRITTPVTTSSLDSGSLVDSGLEKSDATDVIKSDIIKGGSGMMGEMSGESDMLISNSSSITTTALTATTTAAAPYHPNSITNDECIRGDPIMSKSSQQPPPLQQQRHRQSTCYPATSAQQQQKSSFLAGGDSSFRSSDDNDEPPPSSVALCQGQLVSEREHHSSSDLLLTDQLNLEAEKCNPSINQTNLCGNPLDLEGELPHQQLQHAQPQQKPQQYHNMILELVDSGSGNSSGGGGLVEGDSQSQQQNIILSGNNNSGVERDGNNDQCLISVPSLSSTAAGFGGEKQFYSSSTDDKMGSELLGMSGVAGGGASNVGLGGNSNNPTDYLYEFSETRKVLEEFFGGGGIGGSSGGACGVVGSGIMELDGNNISSNLNHNGAQQLSQQQQFQQDPHIHQQQQGQFFDDLGYTLKRQTGNSYVGQRLAGESGNCSGNGAVGLVLGGGSSAVEESPKKPARRGVLLLGSCDGDGGEGGDAASPRLISFQEITSTGATTPISLSSAGGLGGLTGQGGIGMSGINKSGTMNPPSTRDLNDNDIDDGDSSTTNTETDNLGDTEVGLQVGLSRNFTLSPETTDCDSNELESEISLDYEASLHSSSRVGASMPAVEDGLSSGNVSDNEEQLHHPHHHHHTYQHQHASSEQLSNDLLLLKQQRNSSQQQPNLLPTLNSTPNSRQISSGVPHRREHHHHRHHQNHPHHNSHHQQQHHNHPHLIDDDLSCYGGSEQEGASGIGSGTNPTTTATTGTTASSCSSLSTTVQGTVSVPSQGGATAASSSSTAISSLNISSSSSSNNNSGNISNNANKIPSDPNPTLLLMKKQISEIEKEIKMRASQQNQKMQQQNQQTFSSPNNNTQQQQFNDDGELVGNGSGNGGSAQNISGGGGGGNGSGGSSGCVTNGNNGLGSQLNVSSCPDVSTLVAVASAAGIVTGQGSSSHSQAQANSVPTNGDSSVLPNNMVSGNNGHHHHHHHHSHLQHSSSLKEQGTTEKGQETNFDSIDIELEALDPMRPTPPPSPAPSSMISQQNNGNHHRSTASSQPSSSTNLSGVVTKATPINIPTASSSRISTGNNSNVLHKSSNESNNGIPIQTSGMSPDSSSSSSSSSSVAAAIQDIKEAIQKTKALPRQQLSSSSSHNIIETSTSRPTSLASAASLQQQNQQQQHQSLGDSHNSDTSPVWVPRQGKSSYHHHRSGGGGGVKDPLLRKQRYDETPDDDADTDQETDRLLGQTRTEDDYGFYDEKDKDGIKKKRSKEDLKNPSVLIEGVLFRARYLGSTQLVCEGQPTKATRMMQAEEAVSRIKTLSDQQSDHSSETEQLAATCNVSDSGGEPPYHDTSKTSSSSNNTTTSTTTDPPIPSTTTTNSTITSTTDPAGEDHPPPLTSASGSNPSQFDEYIYAEEDESGDESCEESEFFHKRARHHQGIQSPTSSARSFQGPCFGGSSSPGDTPGGGPNGAAHFGPACGSALPGTMFRLKFVGSLEVDEESGSGRKRRKRPKKTMVEEAVMKMKAPEGETQPSTEVDLFISTEKIMVLNTDLKEIMMDHALRTISYIADIGDLVVLMARRRPVPSDTPDDSKIARPPKMICHVFESDEAQYIAQSIGQAFQVAYMEFLKANGIEDQSFVREMDYQEVLNSQEIFGDELQMFAKKELHKEVVVPKVKGEMLGVVIVESGWGSLIPTVVIANLAPAGAAARCGQLNIGDQIIAINGVSLVGLPLSTCQNYIKNTKSQTVVKLTVVPCPPVVEVKIKRPDTKYQLGFSVQNGVICSLLRGGIAERGGVRVGHRIIEINGQSVVAVPHEKIVNLLATSVGEINMKTMPTSMFRLLTGQENPLYI